MHSKLSYFLLVLFILNTKKCKNVIVERGHWEVSGHTMQNSLFQVLFVKYWGWNSWVYSHVKTYRDVPLKWVSFFKEIPKCGFDFSLKNPQESDFQNLVCFVASLSFCWVFIQKMHPFRHPSYWCSWMVCVTKPLHMHTQCRKQVKYFQLFSTFFLIFYLVFHIEWMHKAKN